MTCGRNRKKFSDPLYDGKDYCLKCIHLVFRLIHYSNGFNDETYHYNYRCYG